MNYSWKKNLAYLTKCRVGVSLTNYIHVLLLLDYCFRKYLL